MAMKPQQRALRQPAHADAADKPRVQKVGEGEHAGDRGEDDREHLADREDVDIDLLRRGDEAEHGGEDEGAGEACSKARCGW